MKLNQFFHQGVLSEANVAAKIKDPKTIKMLGIAMRHDGTVPKHSIAKLGPKPADDAILNLWSEMLDSSLRSTKFGDISADGKFDDWLTRLYINGQADYEDVNGEGGDALSAWKALSLRGKLKPAHQDFNKFKSLRQIQAIIQDRQYRDELRKIQDAEEIERHKRDRKEITLVDDDRFLVVVPLNFGSCYTFNNAHGFNASFCTGSSSGIRWFNNYADDGPIVSIFDKANADDVNGKWQMHAPTNQLNNGNQTVRSDEKFAELFPGLMKKIVAGIQAKGAEIKSGSTEIVSGGYDIEKAVADIKKRFPLSFASEAEKEETNDEGPGTYIVTLISSGKQARVEGDSVDDVFAKIQARHPSIQRDAVNIEKAQEE